MKNSWLKKQSLVCGLVSAALLSACGPGSVTKEQVDALMAARHAQALDEEHEEPAGFNFVSTGTNLYTYRDGLSASTLTLSEGQQFAIEVLFVDDTGSVIDFSAHAPGEYEARLKTSDSAVVKYSPTGYFTGDLRGEGVGTATLTVELKHDDHADYSAPVPVEVTF